MHNDPSRSSKIVDFGTNKSASDFPLVLSSILSLNTPGYLSVNLFSKNSNLCDHNQPTLQTDARTNGQTTYHRNTALCVASRGNERRADCRSSASIIDNNTTTQKSGKTSVGQYENAILVCLSYPAFPQLNSINLYYSKLTVTGLQFQLQ